jgi:hypothetical protein
MCAGRTPRTRPFSAGAGAVPAETSFVLADADVLTAMLKVEQSEIPRTGAWDKGVMRSIITTNWYKNSLEESNGLPELHRWEMG